MSNIGNYVTEADLTSKVSNMQSNFHITKMNQELSM